MKLSPLPCAVLVVDHYILIDPWERDMRYVFTSACLHLPQGQNGLNRRFYKKCRGLGAIDGFLIFHGLGSSLAKTHQKQNPIPLNLDATIEHNLVALCISSVWGPCGCFLLKLRKKGFTCGPIPCQNLNVTFGTLPTKKSRHKIFGV